MLILKIISALMSYPRAETQAALREIVTLMNDEQTLAEPHRTALLGFIADYRRADLIDWQQTYVELFDHGRNLSLHLFEHIHGESRDRGQAMVELMQVYRTHGFEINARELPDYIPLFLEFLSQCARDEALDWLRVAMPVLSLLGARLSERNSPYATLFDALTDLAGETEDFAGLREQVAAESPDETLVKMDEIWEEEAVRFMSNPGNCQTPAVGEQPIRFTPRHTDQRSSVGYAARKHC